MFVISCSDDKKNEDTSELFAGELTISKVEEVYERTDFVNLSIFNRTYDINHVTNESNLCDSYGTQSGFGSNKLILSPDTTLPGNNCDNIRIPRGEFNAIFDGASLELGPKIETLYIEIGENDIDMEIWRYHFILTQQ